MAARDLVRRGIIHPAFVDSEPSYIGYYIEFTTHYGPPRYSDSRTIHRGIVTHTKGGIRYALTYERSGFDTGYQVFSVDKIKNTPIPVWATNGYYEDYPMDRAELTKKYVYFRNSPSVGTVIKYMSDLPTVYVIKLKEGTYAYNPRSGTFGLDDIDYELHATKTKELFRLYGLNGDGLEIMRMPLTRAEIEAGGPDIEEFKAIVEPRLVEVAEKEEAKDVAERAAEAERELAAIEAEIERHEAGIYSDDEDYDDDE